MKLLEALITIAIFLFIANFIYNIIYGKKEDAKDEMKRIEAEYIDLYSVDKKGYQYNSMSESTMPKRAVDRYNYLADKYKIHKRIK